MRARTVAVAILATTLPAQADVCLSKREARDLWPKRHIYWYSSDHCWSNRRGPPRGIKVEPEKEKKLRTDPVFPPKAKLPEPKYSAPLRSNEPLRIIEDGCCWPKLEELEPKSSGPIIMFPEVGEKVDALYNWWNHRWDGR